MGRPAKDDTKRAIPRGSSSPNSPGLGGALKDAAGAIIQATAPRSVVQRKQRVNRDIETAESPNSY